MMSYKQIWKNYQIMPTPLLETAMLKLTIAQQSLTHVEPVAEDTLDATDVYIRDSSAENEASGEDSPICSMAQHADRYQMRRSCRYSIRW